MQKTKEDLEALYEQSFRNIKKGDVIKGKIIEIGRNEVVVDIGYKSEGVIPIDEFKDASKLKVGDETEVLLEKIEDESGSVVLSKEKAGQMKFWNEIVAAFSEEKSVTGKLIKRIKGGFSVDIGVEGFLPTSQSDIKIIADFENMLNKDLEFKIIKLNKMRRNVVLSRKTLFKKTQVEDREKLFEELKEGQIRKGFIKNITDFGAFVDLGGIDGLLHITDISWGRISHPSDILSLGQEIEVMILSIDKEKNRVSLGLKQKTTNPWLDIDKKYPIGSKVKGKVVNITAYGAFIELEEGIEGLMHISQMSWTKKIMHPSEVVNMGDVVEAIVLSLEKGEEKISLGIKQLEANPWEKVEEKYPVGAKIKGVIRNITDYGVFVEIEEGIDGLVHISDLSWSTRANDPSKMFKKDNEIEVVVLSIDSDNRKISLGVKQLTSDPWQELSDKYKDGMDVECGVIKITKFGIFVELERGVEGLIHVSELSEGENLEKKYEIGTRITARIVKIDLQGRKISLSIKESGDKQKKEKIKPEDTKTKKEEVKSE
ncbi:MAG: 30S ribosomal protein S1 [bacterium]|nr:30S ribosomal protein S1 [bacterium]